MLRASAWPKIKFDLAATRSVSLIVVYGRRGSVYAGLVRTMQLRLTLEVASDSMHLRAAFQAAKTSGLFQICNVARTWERRCLSVAVLDKC